MQNMRAVRLVVSLLLPPIIVCTNGEATPAQTDQHGDPGSSSPVLPSGFTAEPFYVGIPNPDGIAVRGDGTLLVVNEAAPQGVFVAARGDTFDVGDALTTMGYPFHSPDDMVLHPDGAAFVVDGQAQTVFRISATGGAPTELTSSESIDGGDHFTPFGIAVAPEGFQGPNVSPGDLVVADNGWAPKCRRRPAIWAVHPVSGETRVLAEGVFVNGPIEVAFTPDGRLIAYENAGSRASRVIEVHADGTIDPILSYVPDRGGLAINPVTGDIFLGLQQSTREIWRIPSDGASPELFASNLQGRFQDLAFAADGKALFSGTRSEVIEIRGPFNGPIEARRPLASIAGRVTRRSDGSPWEGVDVLVRGDEAPLGVVTTGPDGRYQVWSTPGAYTVAIVRTRATRPIAVALGEGEQIEGIDFALGPFDPIVTVKVVDSDGEPVEGAAIFLRDAGTGSGGGVCCTGVDGLSEIDAPPGTYDLEVRDTQGMLGTTTVELQLREDMSVEVGLRLSVEKAAGVIFLMICMAAGVLFLAFHGQMYTETPRVSWAFLPLWAVITGAAGAIGAIVPGCALVFAVAVAMGKMPEWMVGSLWFVGTGVAIGLVQAVVLGKSAGFTRADRWALATGVGCVAGVLLLLAEALAAPIRPLIGIEGEMEWAVMAGLVAGGAIGLAQWMTMRRRIRRAGWWVLVSVLGWSAAAPTFGAVFFEQPGGPMSTSLPAGLAGVVLGAVTGLGVLWMLRAQGLQPGADGAGPDRVVAMPTGREVEPASGA